MPDHIKFAPLIVPRKTPAEEAFTCVRQGRNPVPMPNTCLVPFCVNEIEFPRGRDWTGAKRGIVECIGVAGQHFKRMTWIWVFRCRCGGVRLTTSTEAKHLWHCGCKKGWRNRTHGQSKTRLYDVWLRMIRRCENPDDRDYVHYGGRGIGVCDRWNSFTAFQDDMRPRPAGGEIDRIDNDGDYCPENCRWATRKQQVRNRRNTSVATVNGQTKPIAEWSELSGVHPDTIKSRIQMGWSEDRAVFSPARRMKGRHASPADEARLRAELNRRHEQNGQANGKTANVVSAKGE